MELQLHVSAAASLGLAVPTLGSFINHANHSQSDSSSPQCRRSLLFSCLRHRHYLLRSVLDAALSNYSKQTGIDLSTYPYYAQDLQNCCDDLFSVLQRPSGHLENTCLSIQRGAAIDAPENAGWTPLETASGHGHPEIVRLLIQSGASIDSPDEEGWTPLFVASRYRHLEIVRLLIQSGAAVDCADNED
jgi:ankyrin repeat protein